MMNILADDHPIVLNDFRGPIKVQHSLGLVGEATSGLAALRISNKDRSWPRPPNCANSIERRQSGTRQTFEQSPIRLGARQNPDAERKGERSAP